MLSPSTDWISDNPIWGEPLERLAERWRGRHESANMPLPPARDICDRLFRRAKAIREHVKLPPSPRMDTARKWQTQWNSSRAEETLVETLRRMGWMVTILADRPTGARAIAMGHASAARDTVMVEERLCRERAERWRKAGLAVPFGPQEVLCLSLAEEIFHLAAQHVGQPPKDKWVDELASGIFAAQIFGWPFYPMAAELAAD